MSRVSVVLLAHNFERFIGDAIESLAAQTYQDFEIVVADDGSTDRTREIAEAASARLPICVVTGDNVGLARNWARAMPHCNGELIVLLSADDRLLPPHLAASVAALDAHPRAALAYCHLTVVDEDGDPIHVPPTFKRPPRRTGKVDHIELLRWNFIGGSAVVMRADAIEAVGGVDDNLVFADLDLYVRLARDFEIVFMEEPTAEYRVREHGLHTNHQANLAWRFDLYEKHLGTEWTARKRAMFAEAYAKTAYKQLWPTPTVATARQARRNLVRGCKLAPRMLRRPLTLSMLVASSTGPIYAPIARRLSQRIAYSEWKVAVRRRLGSSSLHGTGA